MGNKAVNHILRKICAVLFILLIFSPKVTNANILRDIISRFSFKLTSGLRSIKGGDINTYPENLQSYISHTQTDMEGKLRGIRYLSGLEWEFRFDLSKNFSISIGKGNFSGEDKSKITFYAIDPYYKEYGPVDHAYNFLHDLREKSKTYKIYYIIPLVPKLNFFFNSGITNYSLNYYFRYSLFYWTFSGPWYPGAEYAITTKGLGYLGGVGFEVEILSFINIEIEAQVRYAKLKKIEGKVEPPGGGIPKYGYLYIGERYSSRYEDYIPSLAISTSTPTGTEYRNMRRYILDLSGFSLRIGLRLNLYKLFKFIYKQ